MRVNLETSTFYEVYCDACNDVVYIKKDIVHGPQMLDD